MKFDLQRFAGDPGNVISYKLADGTTAIVTATENGVPFNQAMDILSRAIRAAIDSGGGESSETEPGGGESSETEPSGGSGKRVPTLELYWNADGSGNPMKYGYCDCTNGYDYSETLYVKYDGDGELGVAYTNGDYQPSISLEGNKLSISHKAYDWSTIAVVVYASETATCMGVHTLYYYNTAD